jgi:hypothetical protein
MNETPLTVPLEIQEEQAKLELRLMQLDIQGKAKNNFINFVKYVWPEAILGAHHTKMADAFDRVARGELKRLILNMPPRHTKSEFASYLLPAFVMGNKPKTKIIEATHTGELAVRFGRKVRDLMGLENYREIFPDVELKQDSKAAGRWDTNHGGEYFAVGVGGAMTGRGADLLVIDDPHSEQDALSELALDNAWEWYSSGPRQRLQPGGAIVVVMTRWGTKDLTARLLKAQTSHKADKWEIIEFPAIMPSGNLCGLGSGNSRSCSRSRLLCPRRSGRPSGSSSQPMTRARFSSASGGSGGRAKIRHWLSTSFSPMTRRILRRSRRTTR